MMLKSIFNLISCGVHFSSDYFRSWIYSKNWNHLCRRSRRWPIALHLWQMAAPHNAIHAHRISGIYHIKKSTGTRFTLRFHLDKPDWWTVTCSGRNGECAHLNDDVFLLFRWWDRWFLDRIYKLMRFFSFAQTGVVVWVTVIILHLFAGARSHKYDITWRLCSP